MLSAWPQCGEIGRRMSVWRIISQAQRMALRPPLAHEEGPPQCGGDDRAVSDLLRGVGSAHGKHSQSLYSDGRRSGATVCRLGHAEGLGVGCCRPGRHDPAATKTPPP